MPITMANVSFPENSTHWRAKSRTSDSTDWLLWPPGPIPLPCLLTARYFPDGPCEGPFPDSVAHVRGNRRRSQQELGQHAPFLAAENELPVFRSAHPLVAHMPGRLIPSSGWLIAGREQHVPSSI
jgi:hypothetical protein